MGSAAGVAAVAARRAGVDLAEYLRRVSNGEKHCWRCRAWHPRSSFGLDATRGDGLASSCREAKTASARSAHQPAPEGRRRRGWLVATRNGDKRQARRRINYLVEQGRIPRASDLPCIDCAGEIANGGRHEYDHAKGYDGANQLYVEPVCQKCHRNREEARHG